MDSPFAIVVLIATLSERTDLLNRALSSVAKQRMNPDFIVVIGDNTEVSPTLVEQSDNKLYCLINRNSPGAANTWNTGIRFVAERYTDCYIAILDDDDEWDEDHLLICFETAKQHQWPDAVISGLRMIRNDINQPREPLNTASVQDFLIGNPGWQGSNTFIRLSTLMLAGCFTPGLQSCNDRDLAIRVLSQDQARLAFTGCHTANWHFDDDRPSLSGKESCNKLDGLAYFYCLHRHRMTAEIEQRFFARAVSLFGWNKEQILQTTENINNV